MVVLKFRKKNTFVRLVKARNGRCFFVNCFAPNGALTSFRFSSQAAALVFFHHVKKTKNLLEVLNNEIN